MGFLILLFVLIFLMIKFISPLWDMTWMLTLCLKHNTGQKFFLCWNQTTNMSGAFVCFAIAFWHWTVRSISRVIRKDSCFWLFGVKKNVKLSGIDLTTLPMDRRVRFVWFQSKFTNAPNMFGFCPVRTRIHECTGHLCCLVQPKKKFCLVLSGALFSFPKAKKKKILHRTCKKAPDCPVHRQGR